jgi:hypothetical protein
MIEQLPAGQGALPGRFELFLVAFTCSVLTLDCVKMVSSLGMTVDLMYVCLISGAVDVSCMSA